MKTLTNITVEGKPLTEFLREQVENEVKRHLASEEVLIRKSISHRENRPVPLALQKRGRKPIEVRPWIRDEIKALAKNQSLSLDEIARKTGQCQAFVKMCLRQLGIKRKRGRKASTIQPYGEDREEAT